MKLRNDFSISASPNTVSVTAGDEGTSTIGTAVTSGSAETVALAVSGLPSGATANLNPSQITAGQSSTLTINTGTAAAGTYTLTVTGTAASSTHSTTIALTVTPAEGCTGTAGSQLLGNPGFESGNVVWSATPAVIDGTNNGSAPHSGTFKAWLDGYGTTHTDTLSQTVTIPAGVQARRLTFYLHIDTAETTTTTAYDKLTVKAGTTTLATYSNLNKATGYSQKSFNLPAFTGQTVR